VEILNSGAGISVDDIVNKPAQLLTLNPAICWKPLKTFSTTHRDILDGENLAYDTMGDQQGRASGPSGPGKNPPQRPYAGGQYDQDMVRTNGQPLANIIGEPGHVCGPVIEQLDTYRCKEC
jgi:hypothetical protein